MNTELLSDVTPKNTTLLTHFQSTHTQCLDISTVGNVSYCSESFSPCGILKLSDRVGFIMVQ